MNWFRSHHGAPTDPKWLLIAQRAGARRGDVAAIFWALMDHASQASDRGSIEGFSIDVIAAYFEYETATVEAIMGAMEAFDVIKDGRLTAWNARQPKAEDDSRSRVRAFRERHRDVTDVTGGNGAVTDETAGNCRGDKIRKKKEETPNGVSKKEAVGKGTRLSADFTVPEEWIEEGAALRLKANLPMINLHFEADKFADHWKQQPGRYGVKLDWLKAWRNWCRNARGIPTANGRDVDDPSAEILAAIRDAPPGSTAEEKLWRVRLERFGRSGVWLANYGPLPTDPLTQVPLGILEAYGLRRTSP